MNQLFFSVEKNSFLTKLEECYENYYSRGDVQVEHRLWSSNYIVKKHLILDHQKTTNFLKKLGESNVENFFNDVELVKNESIIFFCRKKFIFNQARGVL